MKTKKPIPDDIRKAIALCAYHIWEREGRPQGREEAHWQLAEAEILSEPPAKEAAQIPASHSSETAMVTKKSAKKKAATNKVAPEKPIAEKAVAVKAAEGTQKKTNGAAKTVIAAATTKKTVKAKAAKPAPR